MQIQIQVGELKAICGKLAKIVPIKSVGTPVMVLTGSEDRIEGVGVSEGYAITWKTQAKATIQEAGSIGVHCHDFTKVISALPAGQMVTLIAKSGDTKVEIRCGKSVFRVALVSEDLYPRVPENQTSEYASFSTEALKTALKGMLFAVAEDDNRYGLNGLFLDRVTPETLRLVGTDGNRLSYQEMSVKTAQPMPRNTLLPIEAMQVLFSALEGEKVEMQVGKGRARFVVGNSEIQIRLKEAAFPDYKNVIPDKGTGKITFKVKASELKAVVQRVGIFAGDQKTIRCELAGGSLTLSTRSLDKGDAKESLEVEHKGEIILGFNKGFMTDILNVYGEEEVQFECLGTLNPIRIQNSDESLHILMPLRLD